MAGAYADPSAQGANSDPHLISFVPFLTLRRAMGIVGILFPFVLMLGLRLSSGRFIERSISHYYHTPMRDTFVAVLFIVAVFLVTYRGHRHHRAEDYLTFLAGVCASFVAMVPTAADPAEPTIAGRIHLIFAATFFLTIAVITIYWFTISDYQPHRDGIERLRDNPLEMEGLPPKKRLRNTIYIICGAIMLACLLLIVVSGLTDFKSVGGVTVMFLGESIAIIAFGVAWWSKGHGIPTGD
jgi:hypothetical protein